MGMTEPGRLKIRHLPGDGKERARLWLGRDRDQALTGYPARDIEELVDRGATTMVLSRGMNRRLHRPPATRRYLEQRSVRVHVAETRDAVKIYNDQAGAEPVAVLFHSTC